MWTPEVATRGSLLKKLFLKILRYFYLFIYLIIYLKLPNLQKYSIYIYIKVARQIR